MDDALTTAIQAMHNSQARLAAISHNVANAATPGFKRTIPVLRPFEQVLAAAGAGTNPAAPRIDLGIDASAAAAVQTGRPLDLMVEGDAYLELMGADGVGYARSGSFRLDASGRLLNAQGAALQGVGGALSLGGDPVVVHPDGSLTQNDRPAGSLKLVALPRTGLTRGNDGLLRPVAGAAPPAAASDGRITVRTGKLENSNVSTARETVMLLETSRSYEALSRFFTAYDEQIGNAIQKLGEF
ncbi:flagellar hook-basal body protein [Aquabacterium humicola]|uniref:flagellar hook-basal body protein n=1 Tax=Aquabacterium humicola TaxID=3237377 RepID=UPI002543532E|nr:flagellar hook basal-body protein [Rubrivivax pictus]